MTNINDWKYHHIELTDVVDSFEALNKNQTKKKIQRQLSDCESQGDIEGMLDHMQGIGRSNDIIAISHNNEDFVAGNSGKRGHFFFGSFESGQGYNIVKTDENWSHPGGLQLIGKQNSTDEFIMVNGIQKVQSDAEKHRIEFYKCALECGKVNAEKLKHLTLEKSGGITAAAITHFSYKTCDGYVPRYLVVANKKKKLYLYISTSADLTDTNCEFSYICQLEMSQSAGGIALLTEHSDNERTSIYIVGMKEKDGRDKSYLYKIHLDQVFLDDGLVNPNPTDAVTSVGYHKLNAKDNYSFKWGSGLYVSNSSSMNLFRTGESVKAVSSDPSWTLKYMEELP